MARRSKDRCGLCGDIAALDANWRPTGRCVPCAAPSVVQARKDIRAFYKPDVVEIEEESPITFVHVSGVGEVAVNKDGEPLN